MINCPIKISKLRYWARFLLANMAVEHNEVGLGAAITVSFRDGGGGGDGNGDPLRSHSAGRMRRCARAANTCLKSGQKVGRPWPGRVQI